MLWGGTGGPGFELGHAFGHRVLRPIMIEMMVDRRVSDTADDTAHEVAAEHDQESPAEDRHHRIAGLVADDQGRREAHEGKNGGDNAGSHGLQSFASDGGDAIRPGSVINIINPARVTRAFTQ